MWEEFPEILELCACKYLDYLAVKLVICGLA